MVFKEILNFNLEKIFLKVSLLVLMLASLIAQTHLATLYSSIFITTAFVIFGVFISHQLRPYRKYQKSILLFLVISVIAIVYGYNSEETESFLLIVNFIKIGANQLVLIILIILNRSKSTQKTKNENAALIVIFVCGFSFILISFQYFNFSTQVISMVRMVQFAIIAYYGLFRKDLSVYLTLYVLFTFAGEFVAGLRLSGISLNNSELIQNLFLFTGIYFFCIGIRNTLTFQNEK